MFVLGALAVARGRLALGEQGGDRALGIEHAAALDFGRVGGQDRRQVSPRQQGLDVSRGDTALAHPIQAPGQHPVDLLARTFLIALASLMVVVLAEVREVREIAEGANDGHRLVDRQRDEQAV